MGEDSRGLRRISTGQASLRPLVFWTDSFFIFTVSLFPLISSACIGETGISYMCASCFILSISSHVQYMFDGRMPAYGCRVLCTCNQSTCSLTILSHAAVRGLGSTASSHACGHARQPWSPVAQKQKKPRRAWMDRRHRHRASRWRSSRFPGYLGCGHAG